MIPHSTSFYNIIFFCFYRDVFLAVKEFETVVAKQARAQSITNDSGASSQASPISWKNTLTVDNLPPKPQTRKKVKKV